MVNDRATRIFGLLLCMSLAGCASIDFDYPRDESTAVTDTADTHYGTMLTDYVASKPEGYSGFYPLVDGIDALAARLLMAQRAERTIDLQYYLINSDVTGALPFGLFRRIGRWRRGAAANRPSWSKLPPI